MSDTQYCGDPGIRFYKCQDIIFSRCPEHQNQLIGEIEEISKEEFMIFEIMTS
jgi:hypothetical protein